MSALSFALDLTEGQPPGHSVRATILGMRIAQELGLSQEELSDLYYALLLKDSGCSSNSSRLFHILCDDEIRAKRDVKTTDWTRLGWDSLQYALGHVATGAPLLERVQRLLKVALTRTRDSHDIVKIRCERGAAIARQLGFSEAVAQGIHSLDEQYNGAGYPDHLRGAAIPLFSRIMLLAQTLEVFHVHAGADAALDVAQHRAGRWFDPQVVRAAASLHHRSALFADLDSLGLAPVVALEPGERHLPVDDATLDRICLAFAEVIDAKSPFTYRHSNGVANAALSIGRQLSLPASQLVFLRRAALLHDIGKLSVPNSILEKPGKLDDAEWQCVRKHPYYTLEILSRIPGFGTLAETAAAHHEKLDGSGYFRGWSAEQLSLPARILVVADIFDALAAARPYREALPLEKVFSLMRQDAPRAIDADCFNALQTACAATGRPTDDLQALARHLEPSAVMESNPLPSC